MVHQLIRRRRVLHETARAEGSRGMGCRIKYALRGGPNS